MTKRILITGASGYLGQHLVHSLLNNNNNEDKKGWELYCLYNSSLGFAEKVKEASSSGAVVAGVDSLDLSNASAVQEYLSNRPKMDVCLHLAAMASPRVCQEDPVRAKAINIPVALLDALADTPTVALSTDQVYDGSNAPYNENCNAKPINVYAQTKLGMEQYVLKKKNAVCLRSSIILGPLAPYGGAHSTFLHFCQSRKEQSTTFYTDECRSVISVRDVVRILEWFCLNSSSSDDDARVYNMGGPHRVSRYDMARAVAEHCGFDHEPHFVQALKAQQPPGNVPSPLDISMTSTKLQELVGFEFRNLQAILQDTFPAK